MTNSTHQCPKLVRCCPRSGPLAFCKRVSMSWELTPREQIPRSLGSGNVNQIIRMTVSMAPELKIEIERRKKVADRLFAKKKCISSPGTD